MIPAAQQKEEEEGYLNEFALSLMTVTATTAMNDELVKQHRIQNAVSPSSSPISLSSQSSSVDYCFGDGQPGINTTTETTTATDERWLEEIINLDRFFMDPSNPNDNTENNDNEPRLLQQQQHQKSRVDTNGGDDLSPCVITRPSFSTLGSSIMISTNMDMKLIDDCDNNDDTQIGRQGRDFNPMSPRSISAVAAAAVATVPSHNDFRVPNPLLRPIATSVTPSQSASISKNSCKTAVAQDGKSYIVPSVAVVATTNKTAATNNVGVRDSSLRCKSRAKRARLSFAGGNSQRPKAKRLKTTHDNSTPAISSAVRSVASMPIDSANGRRRDISVEDNIAQSTTQTSGAIANNITTTATSKGNDNHAIAIGVDNKKERNRVHAYRSRQRRKHLIQELQDSAKALRQENQKLQEFLHCKGKKRSSAESTAESRRITATGHPESVLAQLLLPIETHSKTMAGSDLGYSIDTKTMKKHRRTIDAKTLKFLQGLRESAMKTRRTNLNRGEIPSNDCVQGANAQQSATTMENDKKTTPLNNSSDDAGDQQFIDSLLVNVMG